MSNWDKFWDAYPRKVGKKPAQAKFEKLTDGEQLAAINDIQKRNRMNFWSSNPKLIAMPATYLNQARWEDDWEPELKQSDRGGEFQSQGEVHYRPIETVLMSRWKSAMNRLAFRWMWAARGIQDVEVDRFRRLLLDYLNQWEGPCNEDFEAAQTPEERNKIAMEFGSALLDMLDQEFGRSLKHKVLNTRRSA